MAIRENKWVEFLKSNKGKGKTLEELSDEYKNEIKRIIKPTPDIRKQSKQQLNSYSHSHIYISGINSLYFYRNVMGKRILLLGEAHISGTCKGHHVEADRFVYDILNHTPSKKCLDIFIEGRYKYPLIINSKSSMNDVLNVLSNLKRNNIRSHYSDPRVFDDYIEYPIISLFENIMKYDMSFDLKKAFGHLNIDMMISWLLMLSNNGKKEFYKLFSIYNSLNIGSEISIKQIQEWEQKYFTVVKKELSKIDNNIINKTKLLRVLKHVYSNINTLPFTNSIFEVKIALLTATPMDVYILSRLFIRFNKRRPAYICETDTIDNCIIYSGANHSTIYKNFIYTLFNIKPSYKSVNKDPLDLCLPCSSKFNYWK